MRKFDTIRSDGITMKNLDFLKIDARFDSGATRGRNEISAKRKNVSEARRCCWETKKTDKPTVSLD